MGIYQNIRWEYASDRKGEPATRMIVTRDPGYGEIVIEVFELTAVIRDRQNCFCCSCGDREGSDVACRNHGWAAKRPCEKHGMPGTAWGEEICGCIDVGLQPGFHTLACQYGKMPESVQEANKENDS